MKIKVCGMGANLEAVAGLKPDYLGFIFWKPSARFFDREIPKDLALPKIGVFVNAAMSVVVNQVNHYGLDGVQLHGDESPEYCETLQRKLSKNGMEIMLIKAFQIAPDFDFEELNAYEGFVNYFLFDAKGELPGGNGIGFNWQLLNSYQGTTPYFLSGGIGPQDIGAIQDFLKEPISNLCHAIDVNSAFEDEPGLKNTEHLKPFMAVIKNLRAN